MDDERYHHHDNDLHAGLIAQARDAWATRALAVRWDYWARVEWARRANAVTAQQDLQRFITALRRTSPGVHSLAGFHADPQSHAHLTLKFSRRLRARFLNATEVEGWLRFFWHHGPVWVAPFERERLEREHRAGGGAVRYLARDPGSVVWG